ncbi:hypothetical protein [Nocardia seriolae]|uniref:Uncharacterized protein n=1 Tax=Nocardia seriolae TaxID=37332 RepID=A0A0B8NB04_9NOCA|nr:hypothetical protein [Nocardia seriolae]APA98034.1 hypothetical protein NS506_03986 [Nocardia seriolae]MTJ62734.1 hypothetical protein [Nocardia seriolae]MTJ74420.1 hypothetical protein [Nocardia seriolae]MTJ87771.1 hypothetical protein [Nocardia seriolae]MTK31764.1 hypothetical protein [Nocardia seriolae]
MHENPGHILSVAEIDREIAERAREIETIAATLVELDKHPGLVLLRRFPPTGVTEARWAPARAALESMWEDFGRLGTVLDRAKAARARRRLDAFDREELTRLLRGQPIEVARHTIPMSQRSLSGPREQVELIGITEMLDRMRAAFPTVVTVLDAVETVNNRVMSDIAPLLTELDRLGGTLPELRSLTDDIDALATDVATDPLALAAEVLDRRLGELARRMREATTVLTELRAMSADWDGAVERARSRVEALRKTYERADHARVEVERTILAAPLPRHPDDSAVYGAELTTLEANPPEPTALWDLRHRLESALEAADRNERLAQGLLDRRVELKGRFTSYRAKAARLGVGEDQDVLAASRIAAGLLDRRPCDLGAVTRAITDYRQLITQKTGRRS